MLGVYISVFTNSLMFTIVFPIASKMIMHILRFGRKAYRNGILVRSACRFNHAKQIFILASMGILCDKWGRSPVMLLGIYLPQY